MNGVLKRSTVKLVPFVNGHQKAFSLLEMLIVVGIISVLAALAAGGIIQVEALALRAKCTSNLRQLGTAVTLYCSDHSGFFPPYEQHDANGGTTWYFGDETTPPGTPEGSRNLNVSSGPLYPYIQEVGQIEICPSFNYATALWKPKFKGASYGYGYNWILGGTTTGNPMNVAQLTCASHVILFADCAQVNTFQAPASPGHPMIEEFYIVDQRDYTYHFRHNGKCDVLFVDGHVETFNPYGKVDTRAAGDIVGRITPVGSMDMLK